MNSISVGGRCIAGAQWAACSGGEGFGGRLRLETSDEVFPSQVISELKTSARKTSGLGRRARFFSVLDCGRCTFLHKEFVSTHLRFLYGNFPECLLSKGKVLVDQIAHLEGFAWTGVFLGSTLLCSMWRATDWHRSASLNFATPDRITFRPPELSQRDRAETVQRVQRRADTVPRAGVAAGRSCRSVGNHTPWILIDPIIRPSSKDSPTTAHIRRGYGSSHPVKRRCH